MTGLMAAAVILLSVAIASLGRGGQASRRAREAISLLALAAGASWLVESVWIPRLFWDRETLPAPESAVCVILLSLSILLMQDGKAGRRRAAEALALAATLIGLISFMGHLTEGQVLFSIFGLEGAKGMAIHTAWTVCLLGASILLSDLRRGPGSILAADSVGGEIARRFFPLALIAPVPIEILSAFLVRIGLLDAGSRHGLSMILLLTALVGATWITARKLNEIDLQRRRFLKLLSDSEERYRQVANLAPIGIFVADLDGIYTEVNERGCALLGYAREELVGKRIIDLIPEVDISALWESRSELEVAGRVHRADWVLRKRDGTFLPVEVNAKILPDGKWYGFVQDISERKKAMEEIARRQAQLDAFFDASPAGMALLDTRFRYLKVNEALSEVNGPSVGEHLGRTIAEVLPELAPTVMPIFEGILERKQGLIKVEIEGSTRKRPGERRTWLVSYFPILDPQGSVLYLGGVVVEITEAKKAQEVLRTHAKAMETFAKEVEDLYENAPCGYHSLGPDGLFLKVNRTELGWLGYEREDLVGKRKFRDLLTSESQAVFDESFPVFMERSLISDLKLDMIRKDGRIFPVMVSATVLKDRNGRFLMTRSSVFDYSVQKQLEADLREAVCARDEFLSMAAHDLRTPLTSLILQIQLLQKRLRESLSLQEAIGRRLVEGQVVSSETLELVSATGKQLQRLARLVNDLLDLTRIRVGKVDLELTEFDLAHAVRETIAHVKPELEERDIRVSLRAPEAVVGRWDRMRIDQVLANLVSNAIKYGRGRPVEIEVDRIEDEKALLRVRDHGIGVPAQLREAIFERYERAPGARKIQGLGLGLYITRQMVQAHGGSIRVESAEGEGSTFIVELPLRQERRKQAA